MEEHLITQEQSSIKKSRLFFIIIFFLILLSSFFSIISSFLIGENYFFDKLFYQKSELHGYRFAESNIIDYINGDNSKSYPFLLKRRVQTLRDLFSTSPTRLNKDTSDTFTIAVIGDSFVYGVGLRENNRFTNILEKKLNRLHSTKIYTLGLNGDSIVDNYLKYLHIKEKINPDLYIWGIVENDLLFNYQRYPKSEEVMNTLKVQCPLPEFSYDYPNPTATYEDLLKEAYLPSFAESNGNICYLEQVMKEIDTGKSIFFVFNPSYIIEDMASPSAYKQVSQKYEEIIKKNGGQILLPVDKDGKFEYEGISEKEGHPSIRKQKEYAESLFGEITQNPKWNFNK